MTDSSGAVPPFPGFPGFPPAEMLDRMWGMMRLTPFGAAFPGGEAGAAAPGFGPSLSMMSDMMTPLTSIEELDKRITDLRAVEQWLKLNLSMLQSAIQALEVQRATLSTLRAFGAFAQAQMNPAKPDASPTSDNASAGAQGSAFNPSAFNPYSAFGAGSSATASATPSDREQEAKLAADAAHAAEAARHGEAPPPGFDASAWWNLLQTQFNQLAQFAMAQPAAAAQAAAEAASEAQAVSASSARSKGPAAAKRSSSAGASRTTSRGAKKPA